MENKELSFTRKYCQDTGTYNLELDKDNKKLNFIFGGNGDLCIGLLSNDEDNGFEITKENNEIYRLFDKLFKSIANCHIVEDSEFDIQMGFNNADEINKEIKTSSIYKELFFENSINYHSDNYIYEEATILKIVPGEDKYILNFISKEKDIMPHIEITNSGSRYGLLHIPFMYLYNDLCKIDPDYHQIDMEEYAYVKKMKLR